MAVPVASGTTAKFSAVNFYIFWTARTRRLSLCKILFEELNHPLLVFQLQSSRIRLEKLTWTTVPFSKLSIIIDHCTETQKISKQKPTDPSPYLRMELLCKQIERIKQCCVKRLVLCHCFQNKPCNSLSQLRKLSTTGHALRNVRV